jgi:hypothetical protein
MTPALAAVRKTVEQPLARELGMNRGAVLRCAFITMATFFAVSLLATKPASADPADVATDAPWTIMVASCTGELVTLSGLLHTEMQMEVNDNRIHWRMTQSNLRDVKGVGVLGGRYVQSLNESEMFNVSSDLDQGEVMMESHETLNRLADTTSPLGGDDLRVISVIHFTVNANGTTTADQTNAKTECR